MTLVDEAFERLLEAARIEGGDAACELLVGHEMWRRISQRGKAAVADDVKKVWAHWVATMKPRRTVPDETQARIVRDALKVATVEECCIAIDQLAASDYHQKRGEYQGRRGGRYNKIGHALKGRPKNGESTRDRIDWWLDKAEEDKPQSDYLDQMNAEADRQMREAGLI